MSFALKKAREKLALSATLSYGKLAGYRAEILHFFKDPGPVTPNNEQQHMQVGLDAGEYYQHIPDGILLVSEEGKVVGCGDAEEVLQLFKEHDLLVEDYRPKMLVPGFVDAHIHFPQMDMIGSYGEQLLEWLEKYTFPAEEKYSDAKYANEAAERFLNELLRSGTTTACTFCTVHETSVEALFSAAERRNMLMIAGKVMMDAEPFAPAALRQDAQEGYEACKRLIDKWHGRGRCLYAVTPRFAVTSSQKELNLAAKLLQEHEGVYMHTHMNENKAEMQFVRELHNVDNYIDVYDKAGLLGARSVLAHCVHMREEDWARMHATQACAAFCPTSNMFLGSGLFDLKSARRHKVRVGLGTDVGAGTSFCQLQTLNAAYKIEQLAGQPLDPLSALFLATLGTANALSLGHRIGNFEAGKEADFVLLDPHATPLLKHRFKTANSLGERLFLWCILGDDRSVFASYCLGVRRHLRQAPSA